MTAPPANEVTALLSAHGAGDPTALDRLLPLVYDELRELASRSFRGQGSAHTLQPTALTHEAWLKLAAGLGHVSGRRHFFAIAARAMRQVLTDHARAARADKRGGGRRAVTLSEALLGADAESIDLIALDDSLSRLGQLQPRHARVVELRFLGGLTIEETADVLEVSTFTVEADWAMARTWLGRELQAS